MIWKYDISQPFKSGICIFFFQKTCPSRSSSYNWNLDALSSASIYFILSQVFDFDYQLNLFQLHNFFVSGRSLLLTYLTLSMVTIVSSRGWWKEDGIRPVRKSLACHRVPKRTFQCFSWARRIDLLHRHLSRKFLTWWYGIQVPLFRPSLGPLWALVFLFQLFSMV